MGVSPSLLKPVGRYPKASFSAKAKRQLTALWMAVSSCLLKLEAFLLTSSYTRSYTSIMLSSTCNESRDLFMENTDCGCLWSEIQSSCIPRRKSPRYSDTSSAAINRPPCSSRSWCTTQHAPRGTYSMASPTREAAMLHVPPSTTRGPFGITLGSHQLMAGAFGQFWVSGQGRTLVPVTSVPPSPSARQG